MTGALVTRFPPGAGAPHCARAAASAVPPLAACRCLRGRPRGRASGRSQIGLPGRFSRAARRPARPCGRCRQVRRRPPGRHGGSDALAVDAPSGTPGGTVRQTCVRCRVLAAARRWRLTGNGPGVPRVLRAGPCATAPDESPCYLHIPAASPVAMRPRAFSFMSGAGSGWTSSWTRSRARSICVAPACSRSTMPPTSHGWSAVPVTRRCRCRPAGQSVQKRTACGLCAGRRAAGALKRADGFPDTERRPAVPAGSAHRRRNDRLEPLLALAPVRRLPWTLAIRRTFERRVKEPTAPDAGRRGFSGIRLPAAAATSRGRAASSRCNRQAARTGRAGATCVRRSAQSTSCRCSAS